jgi:hypothetical protein
MSNSQPYYSGAVTGSGTANRKYISPINYSYNFNSGSGNYYWRVDYGGSLTQPTPPAAFMFCVYSSPSSFSLYGPAVSNRQAYFFTYTNPPNTVSVNLWWQSESFGYNCNGPTLNIYRVVYGLR